MRTGIFFVVYPILLLGQEARGQQFHFKSITEYEGLSDNRVTCFHEDKSGYLWIGTENGLNRYDGNEFRIYRPGQHPYSISHERINDIEEDDNGRMWIATWSGLNVIDPATDSIHVFIPDLGRSDNRTTITSDITWDVFVASDQRVWLALDARDLCYYDPATSTFNYLPWKKFIQQKFNVPESTYASIQRIGAKSDHELWLGTNMGLFSVDLITGIFKFYGGDMFMDFLGLYTDAATGSVYFVQEHPYRYDVNSQKLAHVETQKKFFAKKEDALIMPAFGGIWIIDKKSDKAYLTGVDDRLPTNLHHVKSTAVYHHKGMVWIGTSSGIRFYDPYLDVFPFVEVFPDTTQALSGNVYRILDDDQRNYYVSSYRMNVLVKIDQHTGHREVIRSIHGKPLTRCSKVYKDSHHRIWVLTAYHIFVSDSTLTEFNVFPYPRETADFSFIDMVEDGAGNFWFASLRFGVFRYNPGTHEWKHLQHHPDGIFATRPTSLFADKQRGEVWVGDYGFGAFQYSQQTNAFQYHDMDARDPQSLKSSLVNDLVLDNKGNMWVATTSGGVSRYSEATKKFRSYLMEDGLLENTVHAITVDRKGNVWLASDKGLTCMTNEGKVIRHYDANSGFSFTNFSTPFSVSNKGELMIGYGNGFLKFNPDSLSLSSPEFSVVITRAFQGDKPVKAGHAYNYDENEFSFQFSALTYSLPRYVKYYYRMEGLTNEWTEASNEHLVRYTNISQGNYVFAVRAVDHTGKASLNIATLAFTVRPPFWKEAWFVALMLLTLLTSIALWIRSLQQKVRTQKILNRVATSLYNKHTLNDVFVTVAESCMATLNADQCTMWLMKHEVGGLVLQHTSRRVMYEQPIAATLTDRESVATVAKTSQELVVSPRLIDRIINFNRVPMITMAVPIRVEEKVFGVLVTNYKQHWVDSRWILSTMKGIAAICSAKIGKYFIEENIRSHVARDLHDDIGSTLSSINIMSQLAMQESNNTQQHLVKIATHSARMMENMGDIIWSLDPKNDSLEQVIIKMKEFAAEILEPREIRYAIHLNGLDQQTKLNLEKRKNLFLIFKESLNNAAKYSHASELTVSLAIEDHTITMMARDNGKGFEPEVVRAGNGLRNIKERAASVGGRLTYFSKPGMGTTIRLEMPIA